MRFIERVGKIISRSQDRVSGVSPEQHKLNVGQTGRAFGIALNTLSTSYTPGEVAAAFRTGERYAAAKMEKVRR